MYQLTWIEISRVFDAMSIMRDLKDGVRDSDKKKFEEFQQKLRERQ